MNSEIDWSKLIPAPRSRFLLVMCNDCSNRQVVFDSAKKPVKCRVCASELARPMGGTAKIVGRVMEVYD